MIKNMEKPYSGKEVRKILTPLVEKWFFSRFEEFSLPQLYGVMEIHKRRNILVSAPTGATKTLTAFLSVLNELVDSAEKGALKDEIYCVYVSPLKALNEDIKVNLLEPLRQINEIAGKDLGIRVAVRTGDTPQNERAKMARKAPHILITTPESLAILLTSPKFRLNFASIQWMIVDEIHALAENKRGVHLSLSMERAASLASHMCKVGLSATVAPLDEIARYLVGYKDGKENDCEIVDVQFIKELDLKVLSPTPDLIDITHGEMHEKMYELLHKLIQKHKTTLIFTNTRSATERVVDKLKNKWPKEYNLNNLGAHHSSLSREHRFFVEDSLRKGLMKCVVSSTSLELGIDIGTIDLVILLGSPKSVARALQRIGRSGHKLHETAKGRIVVLDRDDLVECSVLLKSALEKKIDKLHIPQNALDVLAQQIFGMVIAQKWHRDELFNVIRQSYCYHELKFEDYMEIIRYLAGHFVSLESRYIYAKIWYDEETGMIGRKGKMGRVIYMTNIGTIPDEAHVTVKLGTQTIGRIDEGFLERLKPGDVFVLGGETYMFKFSRGMVAQVGSSSGRPPTVPSWFSESLPLSFDLAMDIGRFRRLMEEKFKAGMKKKDVLKFMDEYLYVDKYGAESIYKYCREQYDYAGVLPTDKRIVIEHYSDERGRKIIFHTLYGRRVNDCLSRLIAYIASRMLNRDVEVGVSDNGFYLSSENDIDLDRIFKILDPVKIKEHMDLAIENTEVLKRRFRHCAGRALMILRNYRGKTKRVGRQQVSSMILMNAVKRISNNFSILDEARREVLEDLMDIKNTKVILEGIRDKKISVETINTNVPTPFAFNLVLQGYSDVLRIEDKVEFLRRMHQNVLVKLSLKKDVDKGLLEEYAGNKAQSYDDIFEAMEKKELSEKEQESRELRMMALNIDAPFFVKEELVELIERGTELSDKVIAGLKEYKAEIKKGWPKKLKEFVSARVKL